MVECHLQHYPGSISEHLKVKSPLQLHQVVKHSDIQQKDLDSSSTQSSGKSLEEVTRMQGTKSKDQQHLSESDRSYEKNVEHQTKPIFFMGHPDFVASSSQIDFNQSINRIPFPYADSYGGELFTAYGPPAIIQPQMVGLTPARVVLPLELAEDGPIYVNAKQYHGILRRRQTRAKLEAQRKLVKMRKPYLHESRHLHAINRLRGSGGRFLSTKNLQQPNPNPTTKSQCIPKPIHTYQSGEFEFRGLERGKSSVSGPPCSRTSDVSSNDFVFQRPVNVAMQDGGRMMHGRANHSTPVVR
ncbi:hypothetical protein NMG60_11022030 [Bertholletia excelsa]